MNKIEELILKRDTLYTQLVEIKKENEIYNNLLEDTNKYIDYHQTKFLTTIELAVNDILEANFEKSIKFEFETKAGSLNVKTMISTNLNKTNYVDLSESSGGGLNDIVSFIIRIMFMLNDNIEKIIFMDEPFIFISSEYHNLCIDILQSIHNLLHVKIVMVTHSDYISNIDIINKEILIIK